MESDNMKIFYKIESAKEVNGELFGGKDVDMSEARKNREYFLYSVSIGRSAFLVHADNNDKCLRTSTVQDVKVWEQGLIITTKNTVYYLKPITKGE